MKKKRSGFPSKRFSKNNKVVQGLVAWDDLGLGVYLIVKPYWWSERLSKIWPLDSGPMPIFGLAVCHSQIEYQKDLVIKETEKVCKAAHQQLDKIIPFMMTRELDEYDIP